MKRILITFRSHGEGWMGGINYFRTLARALCRYPSIEFSVSILTNQPHWFDGYECGGVEIIHAPWLDPTARLDYYLNAAIKTIGLINPYLQHHARKTDAVLITHAMASRITPCPTVFWMQDFQHCHLPEFFSRYELVRRSRNVRNAARHGHLLFSSHSAVADFRHFFPDISWARPHVLQFAPLLDTVETATAKDELNSKYGIPERFFFLPNQFWLHKNHCLVLEALSVLPDSMSVVCTGALSDNRGAGHINRLKEMIEHGRLGTRFLILGMVPRADFLGLMKFSSCVLNPSLFEGWSSTVEEARFFGKRMILSDLPVHREQAGDTALFFPPTDAQALAQAMLRVEGEAPASETAVFQSELYERAVENFARQYWAIAKDILSRTGC
ncbi:glycosyltransferase family 4 protein [Thiorhodovibrio litoralis]|uniref:glycosyltransferase family 4 protein n=1 Tax=Thiorhodovibrio litoralis TaxID=2952932 RepID=UPI002B2612EC|nr:glycosyltransferase family 1 protein [Thiorhodovibrio litoralis]WPL10447.1 glycosyltransferase, family [Thiorhodovibrio litoralis]